MKDMEWTTVLKRLAKVLVTEASTIAVELLSK